MTDKKHAAAARVAALSFWHGPVDPVPLDGGITNRNFLVEDRGRRLMARVGNDIPVHQVMRFNELAASLAAAEIGLSPKVVHHEPGILITDFIDGRTLEPEDIRAAGMIDRIVPLLRRCHIEMPRHVCGPVLIFWVFHVVRDYARRLSREGSPHTPRLAALLDAAEQLERAVGAIEIVFAHNDLLAANFIDDGSRLWLIDWDYAGFNSPLFDLGGLASNNELDEESERDMLAAYYGHAVEPRMWRRYRAMTCASLLRETLWSMVSEMHSDLDFDFATYTGENLARFERAWLAFQRI